ncbi:MAG: tetratricopeptide repeat protein [Alphaproteobacteria bacterium]
MTCLLFSACKSPEEKHDYYIERGNSFYEQSDYIKARLEYKNAAKILPSSSEAIYKLGLIEEAEGNYQSALSAYLVSEQQNPEFLPVVLKLAQFFIIAQQSAEVNTRIDKILALDPEHGTAHALKASLFLREQAFHQAQQEVDLSLKYDPSNVIAYSVLAGMHLAQKDYKEALISLDKGIALNPKEASLYLLKAAAYSEQNDSNGVVQVYSTLFDIFPDQIRYRFDLAQIMDEFSQPDLAKVVYQDAVKAFPDHAEAKLKLIRYLEREQGVVDAKQEVQDFIKEEPQEKLFHLWLADIYTRNDEHDSAIITLKNIIDTDPDNWIGLNAQTTLAEIELGRGDIQLASNLVSMVLEKEINNIDALLLRANLSFIQGDYRKAIQDLRTILNNNPAFLKASRVLAEALLIQGHNDLAIDTLLQALEKTPDDRGTLVRLAQLYALRGERDTALNILKQVTDIFPTYTIAWESVARIAIENGRVSVAQNAIKELQKSGGQEMLAQFLLAKIDQQNGNKKKADTLLKQIIQENIDAPIATYALSALLETARSKQQLENVRIFLSGLNRHTHVSLTIWGTIEVKTGNIGEAENAFRRAIKLKPSSQDAYLSLAKILLQQKAPQNALEILEAAEKSIPSGMGAPMLKAAILTQTGKIDEAINIYEMVLERGDVSDSAANNMAQIIADYKYEDASLLKKARLLAERFINSDNANYLDTLGWVYYRSDLSIQAQPILEKAMKLNKSSNPQIDFHYGAVLKANGHLDEAKKHLRSATKTGYSYEGLDEAKVLLKGLE